MFVKRHDQELSTDLVIAMRDLHNKDGAGVMYAEDGRVVIEKIEGKTDASVRELYEKHKDRDIAFHLRNQSMGSVNLENAHPYWVTNKDLGHPRDVGMMHNGTIREIQVVSTWSDSRNLAEHGLRDYLAKRPAAYTDPEFWQFVSLLIGKSKLIFLRDDGRFVVVNAGEGKYLLDGNLTDDERGIWVSNPYAKLTPVKNTVVIAKPAKEVTEPKDYWWAVEADGNRHYRTAVGGVA